MAEPIREGPEREPRQLRGARFGGLLEGRLGDRLALERAVRRLRDEGPVDAGLEVEGPRFSLYLEDTAVDPERAEPARMQAMLDALADVVAAADEASPLESTLRCTEYYDDEVVETHVGIEAGAVTPVSRVRSREAADAVPDRDAAPLGRSLFDERPRRIVVGVALALLLALIAWQGRLADRVFGAPVEELSAATGPFGALVRVDLEPAWSGYRVLLARGADYPLDGAAVQRLEAAADSALARAAVAAVADGGLLELRVVDAEGALLAAELAPVDALLLGDDAVVEAALPARIGAARIELALPLRARRAGGTTR